MKISKLISEEDCPGAGWSKGVPRGTTSDYTTSTGVYYEVKKCSDGKYYKRKKQLTPQPEPDNGGGGGGTPTPTENNPCEPFKNKSEADEFRIWVNDNYPDVAKNIPGLPSSYNDKTLSRTGKCNNVYIKTAYEHSINGKTLLELFRNNEVVQSNDKEREEIYQWWQNQIKKNNVKGGSLVRIGDNNKYSEYLYAYKKVDEKDPRLNYLFFKDKTWISFHLDNGYQEEGTWDPNLVSESLVEQVIVSRKPHVFRRTNSTTSSVTSTTSTPQSQTGAKPPKEEKPKKDEKLQKDKELELTNAGYEKIPNCDSYDPDRLIEKINLKEKYPNLFDEDVCYVKYRELSQDSWNTFLTDASGFSALTKNVQGEQGKENCRAVISNTYDAQKNNLLTNNKFILRKVKDFIVNDCHRLYRDKLGRRSDNKLEWLVYNSAAFKQLNESTNKKNMKNTLNSNIKKHLKETIEVKKTKLVENRIIKSRLELTTSNSSNINYTVKKMIEESMKMRTVGIDNNLIKENLMDLIDVLYKDKSTKVKKVFNQESAKYISEKLGLSEGAFLRRVINDVFSNNSIETTVELFNNCDYLCNIISDEVSKTLGFTDKTVEETFSRNMKSEFKSMVCPIISSMGDKMENQFNKMKSKALDKS